MTTVQVQLRVQMQPQKQCDTNSYDKHMTYNSHPIVTP